MRLKINCDWLLYMMVYGSKAVWLSAVTHWYYYMHDIVEMAGTSQLLSIYFLFGDRYKGLLLNPNSPGHSLPNILTHVLRLVQGHSRRASEVAVCAALPRLNPTHAQVRLP